MIDDLADFNVPVLLLSGGEPLIRPDILELAEYAINKGIRVTFSTNGTLIDKKTAKKLKRLVLDMLESLLMGLGRNMMSLGDMKELSIKL